MALINLRNLGVTLGAPLFSNLDLAIEPMDRLGIVAANGRGKSTLLQMHRRSVRSDRRRDHALARAAYRSCRAGYPGRPVAFPVRRRGPPRLAGGTGRNRSVAGRCRAGLARGPADAARTAARAIERRLAKTGHAGACVGDRSGRAASRRADQPPRSRPDQPAGRLAQRASAQCAGAGVQPRPGISRRDDQPDPVPAPGSFARLFSALFAGASRIGRGRCFAGTSLPARDEDSPAIAPPGRQAQQYRHQLRQRPADRQDQAAQAKGRTPGRRRPARLSGALGREHQARQ